MKLDLLRLNEATALLIADDPNEEYTPGLEGYDVYYLFKASYSPEELLAVEEVSEERVDGLTPVNPSKPMFPRKPKD